MKTALAIVLAVGALSIVEAHQQQTSYLTPEQQKAIQQMPSAGEEKRVQADAIDKVLAAGNVVLLDVREPKEIEDLGTIEGAINIPINELEKRLNELPKDKTYLTA
jgi:3-mercaptopyruvate sulfurtransferase SseA